MSVSSDLNNDGSDPLLSYHGRLDEIRRIEYPNLKETYLDHAGTTLYPLSLIQEYSQALTSAIYGNPHSRAPASERSSMMVDKARAQVLSLFHADPTKYSVVFTANCTAAVKLVGEGLCTFSGSHYVYLKDSHTSLVGLRNLSTSYEAVSTLTDASIASSSVTLFSWPAQSNFSGKRYPTKEWIRSVRQLPDAYILLDAAAMASSCPPDLSDIDPDFMAVSFYKIFGFPDLGALIVKNDCGEFFAHRKYFGGGTIESLAVEKSFAPRKQAISSKLEDGTLAFHSILALTIAIDRYRQIYGSFQNISQHTSYLADHLFQELDSLRYKNGAKLCQIYSEGNYTSPSKQGPIVCFNLKDSSGKWIGYSDFEKIAASNNINLRTGTLCNSGGTLHWVGISDENVIENHGNGHVCGDSYDVMNGKPTGAIRISLGACSDMEDIQTVVQCLRKFYLDKESVGPTIGDGYGSLSITAVKSITLFPIKSCGGFSVKGSWPVYGAGLKWDREFCLVTRSNNSVMSLKKYPRMIHIKPTIHKDRLYVSVGESSVILPLLKHTDEKDVSLRVCGDNVLASVYTSLHIIETFSRFLGVDCTIARISRPSACLSITSRTLANTSPLLLISNSSVKRLAADDVCDIDETVFRGNIVISGAPPYAEDSWTTLTINGSLFEVSGLL
jgi:molybdenum cofactor sulfurtransferase